MVFRVFISASELDGGDVVLEEGDLGWTAACLRATTRLGTETLGRGHESLGVVGVVKGLRMGGRYEEQEDGPG